MHWIARILLALIPVSFTTVALAHPGHGSTDPAGVTHQVVEPVHAIGWLALIGVGLTLTLTASLLWKNRRRRAVARVRGR